MTKGKGKPARVSSQVKQEQSMPNPTPYTPTLAMSSPFRSRDSHFDSPACGQPLSPSERRAMRSDAPTVEPHFGRQSSAMTNDGTDDVGTEPVLMEVRRGGGIKSQSAEDNALNRLQREPAHNASFVSKGFTEIGDKMNDLNDALGELQSLGIQHVTSLPEVVLVGDQSAGKSSLMSAFSGIYLPRSDGACTRCPVHIRLSQSEVWSCKISLQQDYSFHPEAADDGVTDDHPFGPWEEQQRTIKDFAVFYQNNSVKVEEALRWAQVAILNPNIDADVFKPATGRIAKYMSLGEAESTTEAFFSPNTVALDINGPGLPDLTFYDLPGVITVAKKDGEEYLVTVVENLAAKYISHKQAIILWAVPINQDPDNCSTLSIIRKKRAQDRTVGVITKADLLPPGSHNQWLSVLRGEQHRVGRGFFITARPQAADIAKRFSDDVISSMNREPIQGNDHLARQGAFEEAFFHHQAPEGQGSDWPHDFKEFDDKCGVSRLTVFVSHELGKAFAKSLPEIRDKVASRLIQVNYDLDMLPDLPANPEVEVRRALLTFSTTVKDGLESKVFSTALRKLAGGFQGEILKLKPKYLVRPEQRRPGSGAIDLTGTDDDAASVMSTPATRPRHRNLDQYEEGQAEIFRTPKRNCFGNGIKREVKAENSFSNGPRPALGLPRTKSLVEVRRLIETMSDPGMPGIVSESVHSSLCVEAVQGWSSPVDGLVQKTTATLQAHLSDALDESFRGLHGCLVYKKSVSVVNRWVSDHMASVASMLQRLAAVEANRAFTLDGEGLRRNEAAELKILTRARHHCRIAASQPDRQIDPPRIWESMTAEERSAEEVRTMKEAAKLGPDPFSTEIKVCAYVRGYYLTAASRFVDYATMHVTSGLVPEMIGEIKNHFLDRMLGVAAPTDAATFEQLMEEQEETSRRREALKKDRMRYEEAMAKIRSLEDEAPAAPRSVDGTLNGMPGPSSQFDGVHGATIIDMTSDDGDMHMHGAM